MINVSIIGCGNIGTELALYLNKDHRFRIVALVDKDNKRIETAIEKIHQRPLACSLHDAIKKADLIIEAANKEVVKEILKDNELDKPGKKFLVMSTGGLVENKRLLKKLENCEVFIPSGAIAGLDAVKAAAKDISSLLLMTTKPASSLKSAPYVLNHQIALGSLRSRKKIFDGNLKEAIVGFPQNINVGAGLFLASGYKDIRVQIYADPKTKYNTHEVLCNGNFGRINTCTQNLPSKNPKTSYLAILSAIATLKSIAGRLKIS